MSSNNKMNIYVPSPSELRRPRSYQEVMLETYTMARNNPSLIKFLGMPSTTFSAVVPKRGSKPKKPSGFEALKNHVTQIKRENRLNMMETGRTPYGQKSRAKYGTTEARRVGANEKRKPTIIKKKDLQAKPSFILPSFFYTRLAEDADGYNYLNVRRWTKHRTDSRLPFLSV
jgi:hypothetical protein